MKNKIICLVLSAVLLVGLAFANGAYAWFAVGSLGAGGGKHSFATGNVGYVLTGSFTSDFDGDGKDIVPEDELLASFDAEENVADIAKISEYPDCKMFMEATSSIETQLRIKIVYGYGDEAGKVFDLENSATSPLTVEFTDPSLWSYNGGYLYYGAFDAESKSSGVIPAFEAAEGATPVVIPLFNSIRYSGENTESSMISGKKLTVKVIFEARQSEFVDWDTVGEIYTSGETSETE